MFEEHKNWLTELNKRHQLKMEIISLKMSWKSIWAKSTAVKQFTCSFDKAETQHKTLIALIAQRKKQNKLSQICNTFLILHTYMSLDSIVQKGHWKFALSHHQTIWILLHGAHLLLKLLKRWLLDHACICLKNNNKKKQSGTLLKLDPLDFQYTWC